MTKTEIKNLFIRNHKKLVWVARRYVGDFYADDMVSDSFVKMMEIENVEPLKADAFLAKVVKHNCLRFLRSKKFGHKDRERVSENGYQYKPIIPNEAINPEDYYSNEYADNLLIRAELINLLAKKREALPERRKDIFDLLYLHHLNYEEIAAALGVSNFVVRKEKMIISKTSQGSFPFS